MRVGIKKMSLKLFLVSFARLVCFQTEPNRTEPNRAKLNQTLVNLQLHSQSGRWLCLDARSSFAITLLACFYSVAVMSSSGLSFQLPSVGG